MHISTTQITNDSSNGLRDGYCGRFAAQGICSGQLGGSREAAA